MKSELTEIVCIIDKSGSMNSIINDTIGGFNTFLDDQRALQGEAKITLNLFNYNSKIIYDNVDIKTVENLTTATYVPYGGTALYDAIGLTMDSVGERLSNTPEEDRPERVIVVIITDGEENSSKTYTQSKIKEMIEHQESAYNWTFMYLGANQDSFAVGNQLGVQGYGTVDFNGTGGGITGAFYNVSVMSKNCRTMSKQEYCNEKINTLYTVKAEAFVDADGN